MSEGEELTGLLAEQSAYYRTLGADYLDQGLDLPGGDELAEALEAFRPAGSVLELACGPGVWTGQLLRHASDVTAVDGSPEMLAAAAARLGAAPLGTAPLGTSELGSAPLRTSELGSSRLGAGRLRLVQADLFDWVPDRRYDVVFFGFWLSHVPLERFASFWALVADCLTDGGRVFFADDAYRTPDELIEGPSSSTIRRRLGDGTPFRIVKVPHEPAELERRLQRLGWNIKVTATAGPFYWGAGSRS